MSPKKFPKKRTKNGEEAANTLTVTKLMFTSRHWRCLLQYLTRLVLTYKKHLTLVRFPRHIVTGWTLTGSLLRLLTHLSVKLRSGSLKPLNKPIEASQHI